MTCKVETSLHRQLKEYYAGPDAKIEARFGRYRIDIVDGDRLIEVQHSGLSSIRPKIKNLLQKHDVEVVKPIIAKKRIVKLATKNGKVESRRWSPKRGGCLDVFHELIYFTSVFPHPRLTLRIPLVEIEEWRYPYRRRWFRGQFKIQDQKLLDVAAENVYRTNQDLRTLLPGDLPQPFDTRQLAESMNIERWVAQKIAYCLRKTGGTKVCGKRGNSILYRFKSRSKRRGAKQGRAARAG